MKKITRIILATFITAFIAINTIVAVGDLNPKASFSLNSLTNLAFAGSEDPPGDDCQPACGPGFACVNGVCVQLEAATRTSCTVTVWCWLKFKYVTAPGHQTTCPGNPGGITNCMGTACEPDVDPC
ncbi:MAG: hypothetical protein ACOC2M_01440 [bacterium]